MAKVFLGGTVNGSTWRDKLIAELKIDYFNPVVGNWDDAAYKRELKEREESDFCLYVITPKMEGAYSIAEAVDDSNKRPEKTIFCVLEKDEEASFTSHQAKSLERTGQLIQKNGGRFYRRLQDVIKYLNKQTESE